MGQKGLTKESFQDMLKIHTKLSEEDISYQEDQVAGWGLGFGVKPLSADTLYLHGGDNKDFQSEFAFSLKNKFGYVFFVNCDRGKEFNKKLQSFLSVK